MLVTAQGWCAWSETHTLEDFAGRFAGQLPPAHLVDLATGC
jgi:hypothetical protein